MRRENRNLSYSEFSNITLIYVLNLEWESEGRCFLVTFSTRLFSLKLYFCELRKMYLTKFCIIKWYPQSIYLWELTFIFKLIMRIKMERQIKNQSFFLINNINYQIFDSMTCLKSYLKAESNSLSHTIYLFSLHQ